MVNIAMVGRKEGKKERKVTAIQNHVFLVNKKNYT